MLKKLVRSIYLFFWWWGYHRWKKETKRWREQEAWVEKTTSRSNLKDGDKLTDPMGTTYLIVSNQEYENSEIKTPGYGIEDEPKDHTLDNGNVAVYIGGDPGKEKDF